jgi:hypothetical protein
MYVICSDRLRGKRKIIRYYLRISYTQHIETTEERRQKKKRKSPPGRKDIGET